MGIHRPLFLGNWKMHLSLREAVSLASVYESQVNNYPDIDLAIAVPSCYLAACSEQAPNLQVGTQNVWSHHSGAYTGETSVEMIRTCGGSFSLVGHSERRSVFLETNELCAERAFGAMQQTLPIVFCVGESAKEREQGLLETVITEQLSVLLEKLGKDSQAEGLLTIAYEPVWAIGTGKVATVNDIKHAHSFIRSILQDWLQDYKEVRILYGGSVNSENINSILELGCELVGGTLVGGASLKRDEIIKICGAFAAIN